MSLLRPLATFITTDEGHRDRRHGMNLGRAAIAGLVAALVIGGLVAFSSDAPKRDIQAIDVDDDATLRRDENDNDLVTQDDDDGDGDRTNGNDGTGGGNNTGGGGGGGGGTDDGGGGGGTDDGTGGGDT